jgi:pyridoxine 5-phosphate synthase
MKAHLRLGINIDHVATIRNARGGEHPDPVRAAKLAVDAGADGITAHLREDRRHILDHDIERLMREVSAPLNLEMAATDEMLKIAIQRKPHATCIVPERREEKTTEGGLDVAGNSDHFAPYVRKLVGDGIKVSLFIEPSILQLDAAKAVGASAIELHTGAYCEARSEVEREREFDRIVKAATHSDTVGLECHAGHGLDFDTVGPVASISSIVELNIGHFLVGEAIFCGFEQAIKRMRELMDKARNASTNGHGTV